MLRQQHDVGPSSVVVPQSTSRKVSWGVASNDRHRRTIDRSQRQTPRTPPRMRIVSVFPCHHASIPIALSVPITSFSIAQPPQHTTFSTQPSFRASTRHTLLPNPKTRLIFTSIAKACKPHPITSPSHSLRSPQALPSPSPDPDPNSAAINRLFRPGNLPSSLPTLCTHSSHPSGSLHTRSGAHGTRASLLQSLPPPQSKSSRPT